MVTDSQREHAFDSELRNDSAVENQRVEERTRIVDIVDAWLSENPGPKHLMVAGRTYTDFIRSCYQFLLAHALRRDAPSTSVLVGEADRRQIEAFLNRAKALWDQRRHEEQAEAEARRQAEEQRLAEERRQFEELEKSVIQRQAMLLQEDERRLAEWRRQDEVRRQVEEQRIAAALLQQEAQRRAEEAASHNEVVRKEEVLSKHRKSVENERVRMLNGQCASSDYYAYVLRDRIQRSAELLFGSAEQPNYEILRKNPELLEKLKELSFGDDRHPRNYDNPYVSAYYTLRYEAGYAFEYSQIYGLLLDIMRQQAEEAPFDVLSIGSGQGLDYWGLRYALSKRGLDWLPIGWSGVDLETWPDHILDDGVALYSEDVDVCDLLRGIDRLDAKVLMFPKVISEMPYEVISSIASWLEQVTLTRDVHYLCFAHTDRRSLNPSDNRHKGAKEFFRGVNECSLDAVKSALLINSAYTGASRQPYSLEFRLPNPNSISVSYYDVVWTDSQSGGDIAWRYPYFVYDGADRSDWPVWRDDATFEMDAQLRSAIKEIGYRCCPSHIRGVSTDCDINRAGCDNPGTCPLYKNPRFMASNIAYQIVRIVRRDHLTLKTSPSDYGQGVCQK